LQISFLGSRIEQTLDMLRSGDKNIFQDRTIYEDAHIFADNLHRMGLISSRDFATYMKIFDLTTNLIPQPDVLIYLRASIPTLVAQIKRRGRAYEMNIDESYLSRLNEKYEYWINNIYKGKVLIIDKDVDDFVADEAVVDRICEELDQFAQNM
jgi:deoxyadenosine/deoxycytidine kinase